MLPMRGAWKCSFWCLSFSMSRTSYRLSMTVCDPQMSVSAPAISSYSHVGHIVSVACAVLGRGAEPPQF